LFQKYLLNRSRRIYFSNLQHSHIDSISVVVPGKADKCQVEVSWMEWVCLDLNGELYPFGLVEYGNVASVDFQYNSCHQIRDGLEIAYLNGVKGQEKRGMTG